MCSIRWGACALLLGASFLSTQLCLQQVPANHAEILVLWRMYRPILNLLNPPHSLFLLLPPPACPLHAQLMLSDPRLPEQPRLLLFLSLTRCRQSLLLQAWMQQQCIQEPQLVLRGLWYAVMVRGVNEELSNGKGFVSVRLQLLLLPRRMWILMMPSRLRFKTSLRFLLD